MYLFLFLFFSILLLKLRHKILSVLKVLKDLFIFICILIGERSSDRRNSTFQYKLYCFLTESDLLDEAAVNDVHNCSKIHLETDYSVQDTHKYLLQQTYVVFFRDHVTGALRGYQCIKRVSKGSYTILHFGTTVISKQYQSHGTSYATIAYILFKELLFHPFTPVYFIFRAMGYKSYVGACHLCPDSTFPCYNNKTPTFLKNIMNEYIESILSESEHYDKETSVLKKKSVALKESHNAITEQDKKNPHIKFYAETNPGYITGDLLITCVLVTWSNIFKAFKKGFLGSSTKRSSRGPLNVPSPTFKRKFSFIEKSTGMYYVPKYQTGPVGREDIMEDDEEVELEASPYLYKRLSINEQDIF